MIRILSIASLAFTCTTLSAQQPSSEFRTRRDSLLAASGERLVVLPSRQELKPWPQDGFRQDPTFYYFTGLGNQIGAFLLLDGPRRESTLFVPEDAPAVQFFDATVRSGDSTATALGVTRVLPTRDFVAFMDARLAAADSGIAVALEVAQPLAPVPGLQPFDDPVSGLRAVLHARWPELRFDDVRPTIAAMRSVKSAGEVAAMREAGRAASAAFLAGLRAIAPGKRQREVEAGIAAACFQAGAQGVSWWPWAQTGPNALFPRTFASMADYRHLDRAMQAGELARIDVGCNARHYDSDVGRTAPVSGAWTPEQAEAWDLLIAAYRAGLRVIADGVAVDSVRSAFEAGVRAAMPRLQTALGRESAEILLDRAKTPYWQIHGVGLDAGEGIGPILRRDMVVAYEPMFTVREFGFYLEDMLLVTATGYELLTPGLPYTAREITEAMRR